MPEPPYKWKYVERRRLVTATQRVTNDDVEEVLDWVVNLEKSTHYCLFSGVHGSPGGTLQVNDEQFYQADCELAQAGSGTKDDPTITVEKMPFANTIPPLMTQKFCDPMTTVILAWCFSDEFLPQEGRDKPIFSPHPLSEAFFKGKPH